MVKYPQKKVTAQRAGKGKQNKRCACLPAAEQRAISWLWRAIAQKIRVDYLWLSGEDTGSCWWGQRPDQA